MKTVSIIILLSLIAFSCQKELTSEPILSSIPTLTTTAATSITNTTAASGGNISDDGGAPITVRGVCWSTSPNPVPGGSHTTDGTGAGAFASKITGLTAMTVYYVRAYATNSVGTAYGNQISFTSTNTTTALATIITATTTAITMTTATSGGNVANDGGAPVTARGVCWSTAVNPTTALSTKTIDGTGTGIFASAITGLTAATLYHVRAYSTNSMGTSYGGDSVFTTTATTTIPTIATTAITAITSTTATSGGTISTDGGAAVTARGVCWSITANPTVALSTKTTDGTGVGAFISNITNLVRSTIYYIRAYATNSAGTAYGNEIMFQTTAYTVYVVGIDDNGPGGSRQAVLWRNGIPTVLNAGIIGAFANSVFVNGNDVYVAGGEVDPNNTVNTDVKVWKNGVATILGNSLAATATSVFVSGNDVYVTGKQNIPPLTGAGVLWKNGVATVLNNGFLSADPQSVFVDGSNAYVAGYDRDVVISYDAKVWMNGGIGTILAGGNNGNAAAFSVFVSGGNVYVAGYESNGSKNLAMLWKNGVPTVLSSGTYSAYAQSVYVVGSDVYVAGYESRLINNVAILWKNGVATDLSIGTNNAYANSVFVFGNDVFVAGQESSLAKLWKNGIATVLNNGPFANANSVFVK